MSIIAAWNIAKAFIPAAVIGCLVIALLVVRGDKIKAEAKEQQATAYARQLADVNRQNVDTIKEQARSIKINDEIVTSLASDVAAIRKRGVTAQAALREVIRNDPVSKSWADTSIPDGVRLALTAPAAH